MAGRDAASGWVRQLFARRLLWLLLPLGVAIVVGLPPPQAARIFIDSASFLDPAAGKPPLPFLLFALTGTGYAALCLQTVLSLAAWTWCGWMLLGGLGAVLGATLALAAPVALWNGAILSESLALSLAALSIGATLALAEAWTPARVAVWALAVLAFTAARVGDFILVPFLALPVLLLEPGLPRRLAVTAVLAVALAAGVAWGPTGSGERERARIRMTNIVLDRVLTDPAMEAYFVARGMPVEPGLAPFRGQAGWALPLLRGDEFKRKTPLLQAWLVDEAPAAYAGWLATEAPHGAVVAGLTVRSVARVVAPIAPYGAGIRQRAAARVLAAPFAAAGPPAWVWLALVCLAPGYAIATRRRVPAAVLAISLAVGVYALAFAGYHGDALEVDRHLLMARVLYRLVPWVAVAALLPGAGSASPNP